MNRILALLFVLFAFASVARADEVQPPSPPSIFCSDYTSYICNDSQVPIFGHAGAALDYLYFQPSIISTWRLAQSPGTIVPQFVGVNGIATPDSFMSGVTMPAPGVATILRVNQTGGVFAIEYVLQVNGFDTDLVIDYDNFSVSTNTDVVSTTSWQAGDVLTLKVIDGTLGSPVRAYVTLGGYFL